MSTFRLGSDSPSPSATSPEQTPFCTSPNQLDAALGQSFCEAFASKPTNKASPIKGRTMRDYEERQNQLKNENFNLKLRIYFLEERLGQVTGLKDKEETIKNNIELKVENESMRKELSEKHELICQAAKAMELLEEQKKKECGSLESKIQDLEKELQECAITAQQQMKSSAMAQSTDSQYSSACFEVDQLTAQVQDLQDQSKEDRARISQLESELDNFKHQCDSQNKILSKIEEKVGVKQADLHNRICKLLDYEKLVSELQAHIAAQEEAMSERENKHAKVKTNAANLNAKLHMANLEIQRLHDEVKALKKWKQDELRKKPAECPHCAAHASEIEGLIRKHQELTNENNDLVSKNKNNILSIEKNALIMRQLMSDVEHCNAEAKLKDVKIAELNQRLKKQQLEELNAERIPRDEEFRLESIQASLREKESQLVACEQRLEARDNKIQELQQEIQGLRKDILNNASSKTKSEVLETSCNDPSHASIQRQLAERDKDIEILNVELRKRTFNLQGLVNKELWDKNKQIERLELRLAAQGVVCDQKELDLKEAKRKLAESGVTVTSLGQNGAELNTDNVSQLQEQLKISIEEQKYLSKEVDTLKERLRNTPERDSESIRLQRLLEENKRLKEAERNNVLWKREASKALSVLRCRLEELAIFLDELIHQPTLVVGLGADRQRVLRAAINGSLELSRTIANLSNDSLQDDSSSQMQSPHSNSSLCILFQEIVSLKSPDTLQCDESIVESVDSPRSQNYVLCTRNASPGNLHHTSGTSNTRTRRRSRSHPQSAVLVPKDSGPNPNVASQSDSEAWSEPDRSVSRNRMGIMNESSRTVSSVASTVRRASAGSQSSSSSYDSRNCRKSSSRRTSVKESTNADDHKLADRTHCLEKLNQALENQLHIGVASTVPLPENSCDEKSTSENAKGSNVLREHLSREKSARKAWQQCAASRLQQLQVLSRANSALSEKVIQQEKQQEEKQAELMGIKFTLADLTQNSDSKQGISVQTVRGLKEKVQELSVQVLEVEVRREQAEQDAHQAMQEKEQIQKDLCGKLAQAEKDVEQARRDSSALQMSVKQLLNRKYDLEKEVKHWKERAQEFEKEVEKWKEVHSQLSHQFKEKLFLLEQLKNAAEQRAEEWAVKFSEAEAKYLDIDCRAKEKICLMEEQLKLKQAEIERRSEELQEKMKREAEIRASRKLEKIIEQRMTEYDLEKQTVVSNKLRDAEAALLSRINDVKTKAAVAASDSEKHINELKEMHKCEVNMLKEKLAEVDNLSKADGDLQRQLNDAAVATSQAQLETARLANEKLQLEQQVRWLQGEAMRDRKQLQDHLTHKKHVRDLEREVHSSQYARRKGCISQLSANESGSSDGKVLAEITNLKHSSTDVSDYVSEHEEHAFVENAHHLWFGEVPQSPPAAVLTTDGNTVSVINGAGAGRIATASPDLGIESDQGRFSSLEPFPLKKSTTAPALNATDNFAVPFKLKRKPLDYKGLEQENQELKQRLQHTRQTLEQTYAQLAAANQRKRLVEKAICKQLHKTHHILRRARDNFETSSSTTPQPEDSLQ